MKTLNILLVFLMSPLMLCADRQPIQTDTLGVKKLLHVKPGAKFFIGDYYYIDRAPLFEQIDPDGNSIIDGQGIEDGAIDFDHCDEDLQDMITEGGGSSLSAPDGTPAIADSVDDDGGFHALYPVYLESITEARFIRFKADPSENPGYYYQGLCIKDTVYTCWSGSPLYVDSLFHWRPCDADYDSTSLSLGIACEQVSGEYAVIDIMLKGTFYNSNWNWKAGPVYVSTTIGTLTQTPVSGSGDWFVYVGFAIRPKVILINPNSARVRLVVE
jgi:hypothetical protein